MRSITVIIAVAAAIMVAGAAFAYCFDPNIGFSAEDKGGSTEVSVTGTLPSDIRYRVLSDTSVPERIYLYLDVDYTGGFVAYREQDKTLTSLKNLLSDRGYCSVEFADAERLAQLCSDVSAASSSGIVMMCGAIPDRIYPNDSENGLVTWLSNGGTLYWSGPDMGLYRADARGDNVKTSGGYFGDAVNNSDDKDCLVSKVSEIAGIMGFSSSRAEYGLRADYAGSKVLGLSDDYSSFSVVPVLAGRMYILGNYLQSLAVEDFYVFADIVACGIDEDTAVKDTGVYHKGYGKCSFTIDGTSVGDSVYVSAGKTVSVCGKLFIV